jgi:hypothetical protein
MSERKIFMAQNRSKIETEQLKKRIEEILQTPKLAQKLVEGLGNEWQVGDELLDKLQEIVEASPTLSTSIHNDELVSILNKALYLGADKIFYQLKRRGTACGADYWRKTSGWLARFLPYFWTGYLEIAIVRVRR